jgi:hypothetical protein
MSNIDLGDSLADDPEAVAAWPSASDRDQEWARALAGTLTQRVGGGWECAGHGTAGWGPTERGAQQAWLRFRRTAERADR